MVTASLKYTYHIATTLQPTAYEICHIENQLYLQDSFKNRVCKGKIGMLGVKLVIFKF